MNQAEESNKINNIEVSIIVAVRNEEGYISKCLDSLVDQNVPRAKYEIILVDGMSDDRTREVIDGYSSRFPDIIRVFDNPHRIQSNGRNIGIKNARGRIIWMLDGHAYADSQFLSKLIRILNGLPCNVAGVGGIHLTPHDETFLGKVISEVQMSILGGLGTSFRQKGNSKYVDTVAFAAYRKNVLERIGFYDEKLVIGEDLELNWRIKKAGFKLMIYHDLVTYYYRKNSSLLSFLRRMVRYGIWRAVVTKKHPGSYRILFSIPVLIVISCALLPLLIFIYPLLATLILFGLTVYILAIEASSIYLSIKQGNAKYMISVFFYIIEHFGIGLGFIGGIFKRL
jgi:cellulose synthase/poly-beta-1,6-N-acetylglucosamine synthase-like glycosyltransferase